MGAVIKTSGLIGLLTGAVALGVAELAAGVTGPNGAPVIAVGETAINLTPIPVKEFAIAHFGTHDKQALVAGIVVLLAAFAALIGVLAVRRLGYGLAGLAVFAARRRGGRGQPAGCRPRSDVVPTLVGVAVAAVTLVLLVRPAGERAAGPGAAGQLRLAGQLAGPRRASCRHRPAAVPDRGGGSGGAGRGGRRPGRAAARPVQRRLVPGAGPAARAGRPGPAVPAGRGSGCPG